MADDKKGSKRDKLRVMKLINDGKTKIGELAESLGWSRDRVEEVVDDLKDNKLVKTVSDGGDEVLKITERGAEQVPKLVNDVVDDTKDFVDSVSDSFKKHWDKVMPDITFDLKIKMPGKDKKDEE